MEGDFIRQRHSLKMSQDFNPRPPWGGRPNDLVYRQSHFYISIHALRGEGDSLKNKIDCFCDHFNPRPPWGGRPSPASDTLSLAYFNPRPPWGGRLYTVPDPLRKQGFQSTPSVGRATQTFGVSLPTAEISIHALRGEGDIRSRVSPSMS